MTSGAQSVGNAFLKDWKPKVRYVKVGVSPVDPIKSSSQFPQIGRIVTELDTPRMLRLPKNVLK
jgi:hypothetical protein